MGRPAAERAPSILRGSEAPSSQFGARWRPAAEIAFLLLLFAAAFLVRLWPIWQVHYWDEAVYLQNAKVICCGKTNYSELSSRPPLLSLLYAGAFLLWNHDYAASLLAALLNGLAPVFLYWAGKLLYGRTTGLIASLLLAFSPLFAKMGNSLLTDHPALSLILVSFSTLLWAVRRDSKLGFALAGFFCALAGLTRFTSLITLVIFPLYLLPHVKRWRGPALFALGWTAGFAPYLVWSRLEYGSFLAPIRSALLNVLQVEEPWYYYLANWDDTFPWLSVAGVLLWGAVVWRENREFLIAEGNESRWPFGPFTLRARLASDLILWWWVLVVVAYFSTQVPWKEPRYLMPCAPAWFLLSARGWDGLLSAGRLYRRVAATVLLALAMVYTFLPTAQRFREPFIEPWISEEKKVADFLSQQATEASILYANFNYPVFAYYTGLPTHVIASHDMSFYEAFPANMPQDGYVILYPNVGVQPVPTWADVDPHFRRLQEFPSLAVYEYRKAGFSQALEQAPGNQ